MPKAQWVKWKDGGGPRVIGSVGFNPAQPWGPWTKVLGVVARCEGSHDTVVMYDGTGVTWGLMQWTFTSGRLQKLLESFKSIPLEDGHHSLFDQVCKGTLDGPQLFSNFGFYIQGGKFVLSSGAILDPSDPTAKQHIVSTCMGVGSQAPNKSALLLAEVFALMGAKPGVAEAQLAYAKAEFSRQLDFPRPPLGGRTIRNLLKADSQNQNSWDFPLVALFFNLWQNNPGAAYKLFLKAEALSNGEVDDYFAKAWKMTNLSTFGQWGWKNDPKSPRCLRIAKAVKEFYGIDLPFYK
jgi:hypothetical protein